MAHFAPIEVCMCSKCNYLSIIKVITCVHPFNHNKKYIFLTKALIPRSQKLSSGFSISCPVSTSLHVSIHSCITRCFGYQYDTFCTHCKWRFFWVHHCDETLNVTILVFVTHEFHTWHDLFFLHCDKTPNVIVLSFKHNMRFSHDA
jgi:hypothetical protein